MSSGERRFVLSSCCDGKQRTKVVCSRTSTNNDDWSQQGVRKMQNQPILKQALRENSKPKQMQPSSVVQRKEMKHKKSYVRTLNVGGKPIYDCETGAQK